MPGADSNVVIYGNGPATIRLSENSELPSRLLARNVDGSTTLLLAGERAWNPASLTLNAGGRIEVPTGAVLTSDTATGDILVDGGGRGRGTYVQTGGLFLHKSSTAPFIVGCAGGTGSWTLGGGVTDVSGSVYVGGALTNQIENGYNLDGLYNGNYPVDRHDAVGTLAVTGGTFVCAQDLYLGCDGTGTLATSGAAFDFRVQGDLVLSNTTATATAAKLAFAFDDANGIAPVRVAGKVVNTDGTSIRIDLGAYAGKTCRHPLVTAAAFEGADFSDVEIVGENASLATLVRRATSLDIVFRRSTALYLR